MISNRGEEREGMREGERERESKGETVHCGPTPF